MQGNMNINFWCLMTNRCLGGINYSYSKISDTLRQLPLSLANSICHKLRMCAYKNIRVPLMKQQFVVTHTIRQNEIPALLDSAVMNTPSVKMLCP